MTTFTCLLGTPEIQVSSTCVRPPWAWVLRVSPCRSRDADDVAAQRKLRETYAPVPTGAPGPPMIGPRPAFVFGLLDADGDGRITRKEYNAGFAMLDTNGDGFINREEFNCASGAPFAMLDKDGDGQISRAEWNAGFDCFDADKDGYITAKEFNAVAHPGCVFDALDRDGDGHITREEYNAGFDTMVSHSQRHHGVTKCFA